MGLDSGVWKCEVCSKPVTRLLGMAGGVNLHDGRFQIRPVVRAHCLAHRANVVSGYLEELEAQGTVIWNSEPAVELRPREALAWLQFIDAELGSSLADGRGFVRSQNGLCPRCSASVSWGSGPHVADAELRPGGIAWECISCGAAGIAYLVP